MLSAANVSAATAATTAKAAPAPAAASPPKPMLMFPSVKNESSNARVMFKSYPWKQNTPKLANTKDILRLGLNLDIRLYLPGDFSEKYAAEWGAEEVVTGLVGMNEDSVKSSAWETVVSAGNKFSTAAVNSAKFAFGETTYPGEFAIFKKGTPVTLEFSFDLVPQNKTDADVIVEMAKAFKKEILPTFKDGLLSFPNIWDIGFMGINGVGYPDQVESYRDMALTSVNVTYAGGAQSALVFTDKNPVNVKLNLAFMAVKHSYLMG